MPGEVWLLHHHRESAESLVTFLQENRVWKRKKKKNYLEVKTKFQSIKQRTDILGSTVRVTEEKNEEK